VGLRTIQQVEKEGAASKKMKSNNIMNAVLIGFLIGIIAYSIWVNSVGLFTLIPLYFAFKMLNKPNEGKALEQTLKDRGLN
jgi:hypothetical protein